MNGSPLHGTRACVFDAYGTIFDVATPAARCRDALGAATQRLTALWRDKQLQYTWLRVAQGLHADFWQLTGDALDFALETIGLDDLGLRDRLMQLYLALEAFPEVPAVLRQLHSAGSATAILSNGACHARCRDRQRRARRPIRSGAVGRKWSGSIGMRAVCCNRSGQKRTDCLAASLARSARSPKCQRSSQRVQFDEASDSVDFSRSPF